MLSNEDLTGQTILSLSPAYALYDLISAVCAETGADLSREYEGTSLDALRQMAALGMGLTFLPTLYVRSEIDARPAGGREHRPRAHLTRIVSQLSNLRFGRADESSAGQSTGYLSYRRHPT